MARFKNALVDATAHVFHEAAEEPLVGNADVVGTMQMKGVFLGRQSFPQRMMGVVKSENHPLPVGERVANI
jgi:hypothetical protein